MKLCVEPLSPPEADFINTAAEGEEIIRRVGSPGVQAAPGREGDEHGDAPAPELIRRHATELQHFHANDPNRRGPGFGDTDFVPIFQALKDVGYQGWVSVEVFDYTPDPETIARESLRYMRECEAKVA